MFLFFFRHISLTLPASFRGKGQGTRPDFEYQHSNLYAISGTSEAVGSRELFVDLFIYLPTVPTFLQMFLDCNSQKSWPVQLMVKASGSFSPRASGDSKLGTTDIEEKSN